MHSFNPNIAKRVGVNAAVIYQNIVWWAQKNAANERHYHEGKYWTYNSIKAFEELFPYLTAKQIRLSLNKLEADGLIESGSFNKAGYDRTKWYCPKGQMDLPKKANGDAQNGEPIPDSKPVNKPLTNIDNQSKADDVRSILCKWAGTEAVESFINYRSKTRSKALTVTAANRLAIQLQQIFNNGFNPDDALGMAEERGWLTIKSEWYLREKQNDNRTDNKRNTASDTEARILAFAARTTAPSEPDWF